MTGQEYIQRQINLVKQQIKGSKVKFIVTDIDPVTKFKKLQYDFYENELQTLESIEKSLKALEIIKEKRVDLPYLRCCIEDNQSVYRYNEYIRNKTMDYDHEEELTEEEFDLVKRCVE